MSPEDPLAVHTAAFAAWLATEKNYSPHTVSAYSSDLAAFFTFCRQSGGDAGTAPCVRAFAASLYGRNSAPSPSFFTLTPSISKGSIVIIAV